MSNSLAIATVTASLRRLLSQNLGVPGAEALSLRPADFATGGDEPALNVYLYQVQPNTALRNADLATRDSAGRSMQRPVLALDLHYLISFRGSEARLEPQRLLGAAALTLHSHPQLSREDIRAVIDEAEADPMSTEAFLADSDLDQQVERVRFSPLPMNLEELSKLWSVFFQTTYLLSVSWTASVVLIEAPLPLRQPLPVLTRGITVRPDLQAPAPSLPTLVALSIPEQRPSAEPGDALTVSGYRLDGAPVSARLGHAQLDTQLTLNATPDGPQSASFTLPADLPAGWWRLSLEVQLPGEPLARSTNALALAVAPRIATAMPFDVARVGGDATIALNCVPTVQPDQTVSLIVGDREVPAEPHPVATSALSFVLTDAQPGSFRLRLRVGGVDSLVIDYSDATPVFLDHRVNIL